MGFVLDNIDVIVVLLLGALFCYWAALAVLGLIERAGNIQLAYEQRRLANQEQKLNIALVRADPISGLMPVHRADIPQITDAVMTHIAARIDTMRLPANVPHTYSPHYAAGVHQIEGPALQDDTPPVIEHRDLWQLYHADLLPTSGFLLGHNLLTGAQVIADWLQLYSALVGGTSGSGKSTLIRSVLVQSALHGGRFVVLDRHFGAGPESLGASLQPLRSLMPFNVASTESQMVDALRYVLDVGRRRLNGDPDRSPLIMVVDETTALFQRSNIAGELATVLGEIAQETRKAGVYAMCIGQNFSAEVMPTTARNSFASFFGCRMRRDVARVMSGNTAFGRAAETLKTGQAVWLDSNGEIQTIAVPNCTQHHVELVARQCASTGVGNSMVPSFPHWIVAPDNEDGGTILEPSGNHDPRSARVIELFKSNHTQKEIIAEVWGATTGRNYMDASAEFLDIVRDYLRRVEGSHA